MAPFSAAAFVAVSVAAVASARNAEDDEEEGPFPSSSSLATRHLSASQLAARRALVSVDDDSDSHFRSNSRLGTTETTTTPLKNDNKKNKEEKKKKFSRRDVEIVVAHYAEDVSWLLSTSSSSSSSRSNSSSSDENRHYSTGGLYAPYVTLYTHGDLPPPFPSYTSSSSGPKLVKLEDNVGKESHVYLTHIVRNYDSLADWTVFTQAGRPSPGYIDRGGTGQDQDEDDSGGHLVMGALFDDYVLSYASGLPHYFVASSAVEPSTLQHKIRSDFDHAIQMMRKEKEAEATSVGGLRQAMEKEGGGTEKDNKGDEKKNMEKARGTWGLRERCPPPTSPLWTPHWIDVRLDPKFAPSAARREQCGADGDGDGDGSRCPTLEGLTASLSVPGNFTRGRPVMFSQGARFAISREMLLRHGRDYYQKLLEQVSGHRDPWQGYCYEYLWFHMLASIDGEGMCDVLLYHEDDKGDEDGVADGDDAHGLRRGGRNAVEGKKSGIVSGAPKWDEPPPPPPPPPTPPSSSSSSAASTRKLLRHNGDESRVLYGISGAGNGKGCGSRKSSASCGELSSICTWCSYRNKCVQHFQCQTNGGGSGGDVDLPIACNKIKNEESCLEAGEESCFWADNGTCRKRNPGKKGGETAEVADDIESELICEDLRGRPKCESSGKCWFVRGICRAKEALAIVDGDGGGDSGGNVGGAKPKGNRNKVYVE